MLTESKRKANNKYLKANYEHITLGYPKGTRDLWKEYAKNKGVSLAEFVKRAVENYAKGGELR